MTLWSRPSPDLPWCAVARIDESVHTLCDGRWDARDPRNESTEPAGAKCRLCESRSVEDRGGGDRDLKPANIPLSDIDDRPATALDELGAADVGEG